MEWLFGLAVLPAVLCGAMCAGGAVVAGLAARREARRRSTGDRRSTAEPAAPGPAPHHVTAGR